MSANKISYTTEVVTAIILVLVGIAFVFAMGYVIGVEVGYKECLDDTRLGKPLRYELVEVSKKWVRK